MTKFVRDTLARRNKENVQTSNLDNFGFHQFPMQICEKRNLQNFLKSYLFAQPAVV